MPPRPGRSRSRCRPNPAVPMRRAPSLSTGRRADGVNMASEPRDHSHAGSSPTYIDGSPVFAVADTSAAKGLTEAVLEGARFIALTGEPSVSRSAIVDALVIGLIEAGVKIVRVRNNAPGRLGVGRLVVLLLGGQHTRGADDDLQRVLRLLTHRGHRGKRLLLVIEDADKAEPAALELLKLLPELHREGSPRAQILLVGRPGLWTLLAHRSHRSLGEIPSAVAATAAVPRPMRNVDRHQMASAEGSPVLQGANRLVSARGASWFLSQMADKPAARALLAIVFSIAGIVLVEHHGSPLRPDPFPQKTTSRSAGGEGSGSTPMIAPGSAKGLVAGEASRMAVMLSGKNQSLAATPGQQVARSAFPPAVAGSAAARRSMSVPPPMRAEGEGLHADTVSHVQHEPPQAVMSLELVEHEGDGGTLENRSGAAQRQNENDASPLFGGGTSAAYQGPPSSISFRGQIHSTPMHGKGKLSVAIVPQGSSGAIVARFDAGAGLLEPGELAGNLSERGHISAHGRLMIGNTAYFCYLSGAIIGHRLTGSASFVRSSGGRVTRSGFTLIRS